MKPSETKPVKDLIEKIKPQGYVRVKLRLCSVRLAHKKRYAYKGERKEKK